MFKSTTKKNLPLRKYILNDDESHEEKENVRESNFFTEINIQEEDKCNSYRNTTNNQLIKKKKIKQFVSFLNKNDLYYA